MRHFAPALSFSIANFNPRTREGCDQLACLALTARVYFNPRTREGCDYATVHYSLYVEKFQSTHPRRVRRYKKTVGEDIPTISIHAPAKGATCSGQSVYFFLFLFQSTHPRRVRQNLTPPDVIIKYFNPRTREGCDSTNLSNLTQHLYFNPRTREGCDMNTRIWLLL